jgi:CP family cyanate transporter-like MFS transporter
MTHPDARAGTAAHATGRVLLLTGLLAIAFNLRPALTSLSPLLETIRVDLGVGHAVLSLLTVVPILCMGVFPFAALHLAGRIGVERAVLAAIALIALALGLRAGGRGSALLLVTAFLAGIGIAAAQTLLPVVIKRRLAARAMLVMALYSTTMTLGAGIAAGAAPPLAHALGGWPGALAVWSLPALLAAAVWLPQARSGRAAAADARGRGALLLWRSAMAWRITLFSAGTFSLFWSVLTWLAPAFREQGLSAEATGLLLTLLTVVQIISSLVIAGLAGRSRDRRPWLAFCLVTGAIAFAGIALVPAQAPAWFWTVLVGLGIGAIFPLTLLLPLDVADDAVAAGQLTAMALSAGYLLAALGPLLMGWLRGLTGSYTAPFLALALLCCAMLALARRLRPPAGRTAAPSPR